LLVVPLIAQVPAASALADGWSIVGSPNHGTGQNQLGGVSCLSSSFCVAVGFRENTKTGKDRTLVESWDGQQWSTNVSPNRGSGNDYLNSVSCISSNLCTAVGWWGKPMQPLVETWDGTSWTIAPSAAAPAPNSALPGVSCLSGSFCVAVGYDRIPRQPHQPGHSQTLTEVWNGSAWAVVASPDPGSDDSLYNVACYSVDFCAAVGTTQVGAHGFFQSLVELWNGTSWSVTSTPNPGSDFNGLYGVSCTSPSSCTAVGSSNLSYPLVESWDGSSWTAVTTPNVGQAVLYSVSCTAGDACTAVGNTSSTDSDRTLVETWNGSAWTVVASPDKPGPVNALAAVSCLASGACTGVGTHDTKGSYTFRTLVEASN
jgi:hypothetical protein